MDTFKIFIDLIRFKLKYKDLKKFKKMGELLDEFFNRKGKPIPYSIYAKFVKYSVDDYIDLIKFNNKYVKDDKDKITFQKILSLLDDEFKEYNNTLLINLKKEINNQIKNNILNSLKK